MSFDGMVTRAVAHELAATLHKGKINKIYQPNPSDILMTVRVNKSNVKLLLSANPTYPRVHITNESFANPLDPPMFCMLMRKHCEGGVIESVTQVDMERVLHIDIKSRDELGDWRTKRLIVEIMGRHSNIILIDPESKQILDGIHHITPSVSQHRIVLPGHAYVAPPEQGKLHPLTVGYEKFTAILNLNQGKLDRQIVDRFSGISPLIAKEILYRTGLPTRDKLWEQFSEIMEAMREHDYQPTQVIRKNKAYFSVLPLTHLVEETASKEQEIVSYPTVSQLLEAFYSGKAERDLVRQKVHDLTRMVTNEIKKNQKKLKKLNKTLDQAEKAEQWKLYGELVTAYMHQIKQGDDAVTVVNYYDENTPEITIPLDPTKSPADNAQQYFKKYNKGKTGVTAAKEQIALSNQEIDYLEGILLQLEQASIHEIEDIREELTEQGYLRERGNNKKDKRRRKKDQPQLERFLASDGTEILVGKNNKQNEYLTRKLASSQDTWLHTKDIPGSHVVIRSQQIAEETLLEAAMLSAYFSKAKSSSQVPVDYTLIKHVKKPSGAKPGYVIYDHQNTVFVTPDEKVVQQLKENTKNHASS